MGTRGRIGLGVVVVAAGALLGLLTRPHRESPAPEQVAAQGGNSGAAAGPGDIPAQDGRQRSAGRAVPSFVSQAPLGIDTNPSSPGYDPIRLALAITPQKLFNGEPRHPTWAPAMESRLTSAVSRDLQRIPGIGDISVECRTTGCKVSWSAPDSRRSFAAGSLVNALWGGGVGGRVSSGLITFYRGARFEGVDPSDPSALLQRLEKRRSDQFAQHKRRYAQGRARYKDIPLEYWPEQ